MNNTNPKPIDQEGSAFDISRRNFLALSGVGVGTVLGGSLLAQLKAIAAPPIGANDGVLVVVFLAGGNDPLNTLIPYTSNEYRNLRPTLHMTPDNLDPNRRCLPISSTYGLHPSLTNIKSLFEAGKVTFIPGVGYSGQDLSHFTSSAQYMQGWGGAGRKTSGWAGRFLDTFSDADTESTRGITIDGSIPIVLAGEVSQAISLPTYISDAYNANSTSEKSKFCFKDIANFTGSSTYPFPASIAKNVKNTLDLPSKYGSAYPDLSGLNNPSYIQRDLGISAGIINADLGARVIHVIQDGYDNHTNQLSDQGDRLYELDQAIGTFFQTLNSRFANRVTLMVYSEFGRRVQENGTGTDHGRAALLMMMGNAVNGGTATTFPSLTNLDQYGNLIDNVDFRQIYGDVVTTWLNADKNSIIGGSYSNLGLFRTGPASVTTTTTTTTTIPVEKLPGVIMRRRSQIPTAASSTKIEKDVP